MWRLGLSAALLASACQYDRPPDVMAIDATPLDAPPPCTPSTIVCDDAAGVYTECDAGGSVVRQLTCPLGCATDTEQCLDIDPHNNLAMYLDMADAAPDVNVSGGVVINTVAGIISDGSMDLPVPTYLTATGIRVFVVKSLHLGGTVTVARIAGAPSFAFVSAGDVVLEGMLDLGARLNMPGPGGAAPATGDSDCTPFDLFASSATGSYGIGGAGGTHAGGAAGGTTVTTGGSGMPARAPLELPLGGCAGGSFFDIPSNTLSVPGGAGGGGLQIVSRTSIRLATAAVINASGGGATTTRQDRPGGGGGAGGTILLEAPTVELDGQLVVISVKGGGGGGAGGPTSSGGSGEDGGTSPIPAAGGTSTTPATGGRGGVTTGPESGQNALVQGRHGGGGGGSAGLVATFTATAAPTLANGATIQGPRLDAAMVTRHWP